jgi:hypothetical protein
VFVVQHDDYFRFVTGNDDDSHRALDDFPALAQLVQNEYEHRERIQDFDLYVRVAR